MTRPDFPRHDISSLWQVLESRHASKSEAPGSIAALIAVAALVLFFYLIYA